MNTKRMKLSVYVGLRSIGWVLSSDHVSIIAHGIKRVNIPFDNYYEYIAGLPVSKRIVRRAKRGARRNLRRYNERRLSVHKTLNKHGFFGSAENQQVLALRVRALSEKLTNGELYQVFMHLQTKRGYKSVRGADGEEKGEWFEKMHVHENNLANYRSVAEYLLTLPGERNVILKRESHVAEFDAICAQQGIGGDFKRDLYHAIYYQRPLRKGRTAKCRYEHNRLVMHQSHPLFQEFRCLRDVANIVIHEVSGAEVEIPITLRAMWFDRLMSGKNVTKAQCLKDLGLKHPKKYEWWSGKIIEGNMWGAYLRDKPAEYMHDVWHDMYTLSQQDVLVSRLVNKHGIDDAIAREMAEINIASYGFADVSAKAVKRLLPVMQQQFGKLKHAVMEVYGRVDFDTLALRNLVLEQHWHSFNSLITRIKKEYSGIDIVQFEIDPMLKKGNKQRKEAAKNKRKAQKIMKEKADIIQGSEYRLLKYQLWEEQNGICPYEPDKEITLEEAMSDEYDLDHIVPKSRIFERGYTNMVLCPKHLNQRKGRKTGWEFGCELLGEEAYIAATENYSDRKRKFLRMQDEKIPTDYISAMQNGDYNTRCFSLAIKNADMTPVNIPAKVLFRYSREWGFAAYNENDARDALTKAYTIHNLSQEHIKALDSLNMLPDSMTTAERYNISPTIGYEFVADRIKTAIVYMPTVRLIQRKGKGIVPRAALHSESVYGIRSRPVLEKNGKPKRDNNGRIIYDTHYKIRKPVASLSANMVGNIMDKALRTKIQERIAQAGSHEDGIVSLIETPVTHNGEPVRSVSIAVNSESLVPLKSIDELGNTHTYSKFERKAHYVQPDTYYGVVVHRLPNGALKIKRITLLDAMRAIKAGEQADKLLYDKIAKKKYLLRTNDIVSYRGQHYYLIGASMVMRPVYTLSSEGDMRINNSVLAELSKVIVNEISQPVATYAFTENSEGIFGN